MGSVWCVLEEQQEKMLLTFCENRLPSVLMTNLDHQALQNHEIKKVTDHNGNAQIARKTIARS